MVKRRASVDLELPGGVKRAKPSPDCLSVLSDELLLRVLSNLGVYDLTVCQRVSRKLQVIAGDSQLWKAAYYDRFVRPRVTRLPKIKGTSSSSKVAPSSKLSKWLDEDTLVKRGTATNWKRQYKLRHKWSNGNCEMSDIPVASQPPTPPLLARLQDGVVYTADSNDGLRAWAYKEDQRLLSKRSLERESPDCSLLPTAFATDGSSLSSNNQLLALGFKNGSFSIYCYHKTERNFDHLYSHPASSNGVLYSLASTWPYLLTMTSTQRLSLYKFEDRKSKTTKLEPPRLLVSLRSRTVWPPLSLSLRIKDAAIVAAIAYSMPTYNAGWSAGVQELHLTADGDILESRLASAHDQGFSKVVPSSSSSHPESGQAESPFSIPGMYGPTSLSYAHPYLLVSHSDNTLTLYMVTSTSTHLSIAPGKRLWGHTSSVFGAHVESRGKAVSVSTRGDEVRVWELERSNFMDPRRPTKVCDELSVQVTPEKRPSTPSRVGELSQAIARRGSGLGLPLGDGVGEATNVTRGWVGFDETNVVVLREQAHGRQALAIYDFS